MASTHTRTFRPRVFPADQMACWDRYCELVGSLASPAGTYVTLAAFPVDGADLPPGGAAAALPPPLDTVAEALDGSLGGEVCGAATLDDTAASLPRRKDGSRRRRFAYVCCGQSCELQMLLSRPQAYGPFTDNPAPTHI